MGENEDIAPEGVRIIAPKDGKGWAAMGVLEGGGEDGRSWLFRLTEEQARGMLTDLQRLEWSLKVGQADATPRVARTLEDLTAYAAAGGVQALSRVITGPVSGRVCVLSYNRKRTLCGIMRERPDLFRSAEPGSAITCPDCDAYADAL